MEAEAAGRDWAGPIALGQVGGGARAGPRSTRWARPEDHAFGLRAEPMGRSYQAGTRPAE